jgi:hypothetical protein
MDVVNSLLTGKQCLLHMQQIGHFSQALPLVLVENSRRIMKEKKKKQQKN